MVVMKLLMVVMLRSPWQDNGDDYDDYDDYNDTDTDTP